MLLRRSLIFWLGLFGLLFILAAWVDSTRHQTSFALHRALGQHSDGSLDLGYRWGSTYRPSTYLERLAYPPGEELWFAPYHWEYSTGHFIRFMIPHWLILIAYTAVWIALLLWRHRRLKRALTAPGAAADRV